MYSVSHCSWFYTAAALYVPPFTLLLATKNTRCSPTLPFPSSMSWCNFHFLLMTPCNQSAVGSFSHPFSTTQVCSKNFRSKSARDCFVADCMRTKSSISLTSSRYFWRCASQVASVGREPSRCKRLFWNGVGFFPSVAACGVARAVVLSVVSRDTADAFTQTTRYEVGRDEELLIQPVHACTQRFCSRYHIVFSALWVS